MFNGSPPVSLAMGLASAAAHAHYVNGMVSGHAAAAVAAAAATAAAQRVEIEREVIDRDSGMKLLFDCLITKTPC